MEQIVAKDQGKVVERVEIFVLASKDECFGNAVGCCLCDDLDFDAHVKKTRREQLLKRILLIWVDDDQKLPDPSKHQRGERIVDQWFIVDR